MKNEHTNTSIAAAYRTRADHGFMIGAGFVVVLDGEAVGWVRELDAPQAWVPGCVAVRADGMQWQARGGDAERGAQAWWRLGMGAPVPAHQSPVTSPELNDGDVRGLCAAAKAAREFDAMWENYLASCGDAHCEAIPRELFDDVVGGWSQAGETREELRHRIEKAERAHFATAASTGFPNARG